MTTQALRVFFALCALLSTTGCMKGKLRNPHNAMTPQVTSVTPDTSHYTEATLITITGSNFLEGIEVKLGDVVCSNPQVISKTKMTCTAPPHSIGKVDIVITNHNKLSSSLAQSFAFVTSTKVMPGFAITSGGGISVGANRSVSASAGEPVTATRQVGTTRISVSGIQGVISPITN